MKHKKWIYIISFILVILIAFTIILFCHQSMAADRKEGIENFPTSYQPYLRELQKKYPNWKFIALYTGLDWKYVIDNENKF